jgi:hypothetical protein
LNFESAEAGSIVVINVRRNIQFNNGNPHEVLRKDPTPTILLCPECNYVPWDGAVDYRKTLPNLKIYYIPHAGHYAQMEHPDLTRRIMVAFLLDQPDVIAPVQGDEDPRLRPAAPNSAQGARRASAAPRAQESKLAESTDSTAAQTTDSVVS